MDAKAILVLLLMLMALVISAAGQQTANEWNNRGIDLAQQGKYDEAIKAFNNAIAINPQFAEAWYNKGKALYAQGKYDEAIKAFDTAIKINPQFAAAWNNKGEALYAQGKYNESIEAFNNAIAIDPQFAEAWYNKGKALYAQGKYDEAIKAFDIAKAITQQLLDKAKDKLRTTLYHSYESYNYPGYFIRHAYGLGELSDFTGEITALDVGDSTFALVQGLADNSYVSFQSKNYPASYLRHQNGRIKLGDSTTENSQLFKEDATFKRVPGLADSSGISFESYNYPGYYLRHREGHLWVEQNDNSQLFREDATFKEEKPRVADTISVTQSQLSRLKNYPVAANQLPEDTISNAEPENKDNADYGLPFPQPEDIILDAEPENPGGNDNPQPSANIVMKLSYADACCCSDDPRCQDLLCQGSIGHTWTFMDDYTWWEKSPQEIEGHWSRDGDQFSWSDRSGKVHYLKWDDENYMEGHYDSNSCYNMIRIS